MRYTIIILCLSLAACKSRDGFVIHGSIKGISSGTAKLTMEIDSNRTHQTIDSVALVDGAFTLKGKVGTSTMMSIIIDSGNWSFPLFVENSDITVTGDTAGSFYYDYTKYGSTKGAQLKNYTIAGSSSNSDWVSYQNDPGLKVYDTVIKGFYKDVEAGIAAHNKDAEYAARDKADSVRNLQSALELSWIKKYIAAHPSSGVGLQLFTQYYEFNMGIPAQDMENVLHTFSDSVYSTSQYAFLMRKLAQKKALLPGQLAPDFTLLRKDSTKFTLSSTRGRYVMLDFWASWCYPCRKAIPHWKDAYAKYHDKGLDIVSITDDNNWNSWFKAMDQEKMPWTQVADEFAVKNMPARVGDLYMSQYIPMYVLLDKDGKIILFNPSETDMDKKLSSLMP
jgi:thiol-disulfide isomerase/thioredoxin